MAYLVISSISKLNKKLKTTVLEDVEAGVYKIPWQGCNKVYFGEPGCSFDMRLKEHERDVTNCNVNNAFFFHKIGFDHNTNWDEAKLLFKCNNYFTR